jgi:hypothetical protein
MQGLPNPEAAIDHPQTSIATSFSYDLPIEKQIRLIAEAGFSHLSLGALLPADYVGERHLVVVKQLESRSPNIEWCEMKERPGPAPESDRNIFTVRFVDSPESRS